MKRSVLEGEALQKIMEGLEDKWSLTGLALEPYRTVKHASGNPRKASGDS